jgi:hypothetical protein
VRSLIAIAQLPRATWVVVATHATLHPTLPGPIIYSPTLIPRDLRVLPPEESERERPTGQPMCISPLSVYVAHTYPPTRLLSHHMSKPKREFYSHGNSSWTSPDVQPPISGLTAKLAAYELWRGDQSEQRRDEGRRGFQDGCGSGAVG